MNEAERFAARLRELRQEKGFTQGQLAERVGVTVRSISRLETGVQEPTWPIVLKLAAALGVDCSAFQGLPVSSEPAERGRPVRATEGKPAKKSKVKRK